jgi:hypothetical protein
MFLQRLVDDVRDDWNNVYLIQSYFVDDQSILNFDVFPKEKNRY